ncbi:MAG: ATP-dependent exoDNAse (exonuclease V) alpha subunit [Crocinitomix sp.]|jgi:ATP-dependent exoDNAse (exonuclease V) alpha subunit
MTQEKALQLLKSGRNIFLTGSAGTGKTYVLNQFIKHLKDAKVEVAVTASTGIAATHILGVTIHSWAGIGIKQKISEKDLAYLKKQKAIRTKFNKTKVLIIDEISMLHKDQLNSIHHVLSYCMDSNAAFGGVQIVLCGDFFQLPPIGDYREKSRDKFAFMSDAWQFGDMVVCYLTEQFRQTKNQLNQILEEIRSGGVSQNAIDALNGAKSTRFSEGIEPTMLYTHNKDVDFINNEHLAKLPGKSRYFKAKTKGEKAMTDLLKRSVLTQDDMALRIGAKVMFVKNNPERDFINGTLGEIIDYTSLGFPLVKTLDGNKITASTEEWTITNENGQTIASYQQIPLRLAWAITVHKSQGMTLDAAELDLSKTFERGQGYVALSRLRNLERLRLLGFNNTALQVDPLALKADSRFQELSDLNDENFTTEDLDLERKTFIKKSGGRVLNKLD